MKNKRTTFGLMVAALAGLAPAALASAGGDAGPQIGPVPVAFILFGLTLLGVALFHHRTLQVAVTGLVVIGAFKLLFVHDFMLVTHLQHEWVILANLLGLLTGFDILAHHFSASRVPSVLPRILPDDWKGPFVLLVLVWVFSGFLDNIAAAMIGATIAASVFRGRVHIGYLAAIVAASNAGGAGSVVGDTTTTMLWIAGVNPVHVLPAYLAAAVALVISGVVGSIQQHCHHPIAADAPEGVRVDGGRVAVVLFILGLAITVNVVVNVRFTGLADSFPWIGAAVWLAILLTSRYRKPHWSSLPAAFRGSLFLLSLVFCASMMPVDKLPAASWTTTFGLGFVSAVFDNIPLTKLALDQGGYDWALLAFAVGFGGSMVWFGSSAGVAVSNYFPQAKSVGQWLRHGWHVPLAYVAGFLVLYGVLGWHPAPRADDAGGAHGPGASHAVSREAEPAPVPSP